MSLQGRFLVIKCIEYPSKNNFNQINMSTQSSFKTYIYVAAEALPCLLCLINTFIWVFITSAPTTSVIATWFWIGSIVVSMIISISYLIYHHEIPPTARWSWYNISNLQQATLNIIRSFTSSTAVSLLAIDIAWNFLRYLVSDLKPLGSPDRTGDDIEKWVIAVVVGIVIHLAVILLFLVLLLEVLRTDVSRLQTALQEARGEREEWERRERLNQEELGTISGEQEEWK